MNMKRKFWTISLLGAMVVTQTVPQVMVSAAQTRKNRVLLKIGRASCRERVSHQV